MDERELDWPNWHLWWSDERDVPPHDELSNEKLARDTLLSKVSVPEEQIHPLRSMDVELPARFDLILLGIGPDGHTASLFNGPDLQDALDAPKARRAVGVMPDPMPEDAPVPRITLTRAAILSARTVLFTLTGSEKRELLERAIEDGQSSKLPVGRLLAEAEQPIDIHWAP